MVHPRGKPEILGKGIDSDKRLVGKTAKETQATNAM